MIGVSSRPPGLINDKCDDSINNAFQQGHESGWSTVLRDLKGKRTTLSGAQPPEICLTQLRRGNIK